MPVILTEKLSSVTASPTTPSDAMLAGKGKCIFIAPSHRHIEELEKILLAQNNAHIWGETIFTPSTLLKKYADSLKRPTTPLMEKAIICDIVRRTGLSYFEQVKSEPSIIDEFISAISLLRNNLISSIQLENDLSERGSLKEFDLLKVYKAYEERLAFFDLVDDGAKFAALIKNLETNQFPPKDTQSLILLGFEHLPPAIIELIAKISSSRPDINISICWDNLPDNPIYSRYIGFLRKNLARTGVDLNANNSKKVETDKWGLNAKCEIHACRSVGNEHRFIAEKIYRSIAEGSPPEKIGVVLRPDPETITSFIDNFKIFGLIPEDAAVFSDGYGSVIRKTLETRNSLQSLAEKLEERIANKLVEAFKRGPHLPETARNLSDLSLIFSEIYQLEYFKKMGIDENFALDVMSSRSPDPKSMIDASKCGFNLIWWGEGIYPDLETVFLPSAYRGGIPPEPRCSIFFQDTSFLSGNAPDYFAELFPTSEILRAKESLTFRKYLHTAKNLSVISYPRITNDGKETYAAGIMALIDACEFDEGHRPRPITGAQNSLNGIKRRAEMETALKNRLKKNPPSVISDAKAAADIKMRFMDHIFSASQLETFARCPYKYFLGKVIGLEPIDPPTQEINPKHRGTIIHRALELFFMNETENVLQHFRGNTSLDVLFTKMGEYVDASINENRKILSQTHESLVEQFKKKATAICVNCLTMEISFIAAMKFPLLPKYTEWEFGKNGKPFLKIKTDRLEKEALVSGCVDRIDFDDAHKTFSITDYKTGKTESVIGKIGKGEHLQLPIYIEAARKVFSKDAKPVGAFLFSLNTMEKKHGMALADERDFYFKGMNRRMFVLEDEWAQLINTAISTAADYVAKIREAQFSENLKNCGKFCDFKDICRYGKK